MNLYLLSSRSIVSSVSWSPIYELEDILINSCSAQLLLPVHRQLYKKALRYSWSGFNLTEKIVRKSVGMYEFSDQPIILDNNERNVLMLIGINGNDLSLLSSIPKWRKTFDLVVAYIWDSWGPEIYSKEVYKIDHLFVALPEVITELKKSFSIPVSLIPLAADVLNQGSGQKERPIDLFNFGRVPRQFDQAFFNKFNQPGSKRIYYRSTPRSTDTDPQLPYEKRLDQEDSNLLYHILRNTKISPAFDTLFPGMMRKFPYSFITLRWFYCVATGCAIIGKRPTTPLADELLNWENATIELPDDPEQATEFTEELLNNVTLLQTIHKRNYVESLLRHDWRLRIKDMFEVLKLELPEQICKEILELQILYQLVAGFEQN